MNMRNFTFFASLFLFMGCSMSQKFPNSRKSHIGEYSVIDPSDSGFYATLEYLGYEKSPEARNLPDSLPVLKFLFKNNDDYDVVVEFPFNWSKTFVTEPAFFNFRNIISEKYRMEYFYPDKIDTINDFIRSPVHILVPAKEQLAFDAFIYHNDLYTIDDQVQEFTGKVDGLWKFAATFEYFYKNKEPFKLSHYTTESIEILLKNIDSNQPE